MKNRNRLLCLSVVSAFVYVLFLGLGTSPPTAHASCVGTTTVSNSAELNTALQATSIIPSDCTYTIAFANNITLSEDATPINSAGKVVINGNDHRLNGDNQQWELLRIEKGEVTINNLRIRQGKRDGIWVDSAASKLRLNDSKVVDNGRNGLTAVGAAEVMIHNSDFGLNGEDGVYTLEGTWIEIYSSAFYENGESGIYQTDSGALVVEQSWIANNSDYGLRVRNGLARLEASTVVNNRIGVANGKTGDTEAQLKVYNSTIANNTEMGIRRETGSLTVTNSTIVNNGDDGIDISRNSDVAIYNTLFANNGGLDCHRRDSSSATIVVRNSLVGTSDSACNVDAADGNNLVNVEPKLAGLNAHGGPEVGYLVDNDTYYAKVYKLASDSPAIDAGDNTHADIAELAVDQRGQPRKHWAKTASDRETVDMGAYEVQESGLSGTAVSSTSSTNIFLILALGGVLLLGMAVVVVRQRQQG